MFLIDDDDAQSGDRREHGRARADHDARRAAFETAPFVETLARCQRRMENRHLIAKVCPQAARENRRQRDLGHEHHRGSTPRERGAHGTDVDLRFAASRHAVEKERRIGVLFLSRFNFAERGGLLRG